MGYNNAKTMEADMHTHPPVARADHGRFHRNIGLFGCALIILLSACSNLPGGDSNLSETQIAMGVQMTVNAQQVEQSVQTTLAAQNATQAFMSAQSTMNAQVVQPTAPPAVDYAATQASLDVQATSLALQATAQQAAIQQPTAQPPTEAPTAAPPPPTEAPDLDTFMKSASILLYEDMVAHPDTIRYIKRTLDEMGLTYVDTGNAIGRFKSQLLTKGPQGKGWDLVIIGSEAKSGASGEFFQYAMDALDAGSSVIYELWFLDEKMGANGYALISRCGLEVYRDWSQVPPERMVMFPVNTEHEIMHEPNDGLTFTKVTDYWAYNFDIGDLMRKSDVGGDATILVGTIGTDPTGHGTLSVCVDDQLIMQTFSSHQLTYDVMRRVWENYIHHALKTRMLNSPP